MHANKVFDFYDNSAKKVKKKLFKVYKTDQLTQERKKQICNIYEAVQDLETVKIFIKDILKDKYIIKEYENAYENRIDFSYKDGILEDCLEKLGKTKSNTVLVFVYGIICKIKQYPKIDQPFAMNSFVDILFLVMHNYDKGGYTSNNLVNTIKGFYKLIKK
ncbi:DUF643 domain-containing protein [Borreliella yangtzensis]